MTIPGSRGVSLYEPSLVKLSLYLHMFCLISPAEDSSIFEGVSRCFPLKGPSRENVPLFVLVLGNVALKNSTPWILSVEEEWEGNGNICTCTECVSQTLLLGPAKVFQFRVNKNRVLEKSQNKGKKILFGMFHGLKKSTTLAIILNKNKYNSRLGCDRFCETNELNFPGR
jgi:hypothetical protein